MISPYILAVTGESSGVLKGKKGKKAIGEYWGTALAKYPKLHFKLRQVFIGVQSVVIYDLGINNGLRIPLFLCSMAQQSQ